MPCEVVCKPANHGPRKHIWGLAPESCSQRQYLDGISELVTFAWALLAIGRQGKTIIRPSNPGHVGKGFVLTKLSVLFLGWCLREVKGKTDHLGPALRGNGTVLQLLQATRSREVQKKCLHLLQVAVRMGDLMKKTSVTLFNQRFVCVPLVDANASWPGSMERGSLCQGLVHMPFCIRTYFSFRQDLTKKLTSLNKPEKGPLLENKFAQRVLFRFHALGWRNEI